MNKIEQLEHELQLAIEAEQAQAKAEREAERQRREAEEKARSDAFDREAEWYRSGILKAPPVVRESFPGKPLQFPGWMLEAVKPPCPHCGGQLGWGNYDLCFEGGSVWPCPSMTCKTCQQVCLLDISRHPVWQLRGQPMEYLP